jgi:hypothetical protein
MKLGLTRSQSRDAVTAIGAMTLALITVVLWQAIFIPRMAQDWFGDSLKIPVARFSVLSGNASLLADGLLEVQPDNNLIAIDIPLALLRAELQPYLRVHLQRRDEATKVASLQWAIDSGVATQSLEFNKQTNLAQEWGAKSDTRWMGSVPSVRLHIATSLPVIVGPFFTRADSVTNRLSLMWEGWFGFHPWKMSDVNFIEVVDATENYYFNLSVVIALMLVWASYSIFQRWRKTPIRLTFLLMTFLASWVWSTARWEIELLQKTVNTWQRFAGKTNHEQHLAADDNEYYWTVHTLQLYANGKPALREPLRIFFDKSNRYDLGKLTYYATPSRLQQLESPPTKGTVFAVINIANGYSSISQRLSLLNGTTFRAEKIAERGGAAVYRAL